LIVSGKVGPNTGNKKKGKKRGEMRGRQKGGAKVWAGKKEIKIEGGQKRRKRKLDEKSVGGGWV